MHLPGGVPIAIHRQPPGRHQDAVQLLPFGDTAARFGQLDQYSNFKFVYLYHLPTVCRATAHCSLSVTVSWRGGLVLLPLVRHGRFRDQLQLKPRSAHASDRQCTMIIYLLFIFFYVLIGGWGL